MNEICYHDVSADWSRSVTFRLYASSCQRLRELQSFNVLTSLYLQLVPVAAYRLYNKERVEPLQSSLGASLIIA